MVRPKIEIKLRVGRRFLFLLFLLALVPPLSAIDVWVLHPRITSPASITTNDLITVSAEFDGAYATIVPKRLDEILFEGIGGRRITIVWRVQLYKTGWIWFWPELVGEWKFDHAAYIDGWRRLHIYRSESPQEIVTEDYKEGWQILKSLQDAPLRALHEGSSTYFVKVKVSRSSNVPGAAFDSEWAASPERTIRILRGVGSRNSAPDSGSGPLTPPEQGKGTTGGHGAIVSPEKTGHSAPKTVDWSGYRAPATWAVFRTPHGFQFRHPPDCKFNTEFMTRSSTIKPMKGESFAQVGLIQLECPLSYLVINIFVYGNPQKLSARDWTNKYHPVAEYELKNVSQYSAVGFARGWSLEALIIAKERYPYVVQFTNIHPAGSNREHFRRVISSFEAQ